MNVKINGDYHEFGFSGIAQELVDSTSFTSGIGQLSAFPAEPALGTFDYSIVPGNLGQVWLGNVPGQFFTLTDAQLSLSNNWTSAPTSLDRAYQELFRPAFAPWL